jgi:type VI secretion system protein ImpH
MDAAQRDAHAGLTTEVEPAPEASAPGLPAPAPAEGVAPGPARDDRAARVETARRHGFLPLLLALDRLTPGALDVGGEVSPDAEQLRFRHDPALAFSASDVTSAVERTLPPDPSDFTDRERSRWEIVTTFLGLTGAVTPLPVHLAEEVAQGAADDPRSRDFLDLFHHRALSLLARGLLAQDPAAMSRTDAADPWSLRLAAWLGRDGDGPGTALGEGGGAQEAGRSSPRWGVLRAAALLSERALTAAALEAILNDALADALPAGARVAVEQFVAQWGPIPEADRTRLGAAATVLGESVVLGRSVLDAGSRIAAVVGPLDRGGYLRLSSTREPVARLRAALAAATRGELTCDVVLLLAPGAAPGARLARDGARLGVDAWLGSQPVETRVRPE